MKTRATMISQSGIVVLVIIHLFAFPAMADESVPPMAGGIALKEAFHFSMSAERNEVRPCEPVRLKLMLRNVSEEPVPLLTEGLGSECSFRVTSKAINPVEPTAFGKKKASYPREGSVWGSSLAPGREVYGQVLINRLFDMTLSGEYTVVAEWRPMESIGTRSSVPLTATATIVVLEAAAPIEIAPTSGGESSPIIPATEGALEPGK